MARCWAYETAVVVGADRDVEEDIPVSPLTAPYYEYFGPEHRLNLRVTREVRLGQLPQLNEPQPIQAIVIVKPEARTRQYKGLRCFGLGS